MYELLDDNTSYLGTIAVATTHFFTTYSEFISSTKSAVSGSLSRQ